MRGARARHEADAQAGFGKSKRQLLVLAHPKAWIETAHSLEVSTPEARRIRVDKVDPGLLRRAAVPALVLVLDEPSHQTALPGRVRTPGASNARVTQLSSQRGHEIRG